MRSRWWRIESGKLGMIDSPVRKARNQTIRGLLRQLDLHGPGEAAHANRVAVYAVSTGARLGMCDSELLDLRYAAELHDVGKISVDRSLLSKLGHLSEEEIEQLRNHARNADELLADHDWLKPAVEMIRHHHERWDGHGYPAGLSREMIPLGSRIIGVAETFDTLISGTPWMAGWAESEALAEIKKSAGLQFDPKVCEAFFAIQPLIQPLTD